MTVDYRELLKKAIRGQVYDGIVSLPCGFGDRDETSIEELREFARLAREVHCEEATDAFAEDNNRVHIDAAVRDFNRLAVDCKAEPMQAIWFGEKTVILV